MHEQKKDKIRLHRRHVRLRCSIQVGREEFFGFTNNVSAEGLYVRVMRPPQEPIVHPHERLRVRFRLPTHHAVIDASATVMWTHRGDRDVGGQAAFGLGLHLDRLDAEPARRLRQFVQEFRYTIVVACSDPAELETLVASLVPEYQVLPCDSGATALSTLRAHEVGALLTDETLHDMPGAQLLDIVGARLPHAHMVKMIIAAEVTTDVMHQLVNQAHIFQVLRRPFLPQQLKDVVRHGVEIYAMAVENERLNGELERANQRLLRENSYLRRRYAPQNGFAHLVGKSPAFTEVLTQLERVRTADTSVHIQGETGTGKELVARALHFGSPRAAGPFVAQNCGSIPESLLQSTLFGHRKGAFTGAHRDRRGLFQEADGGSLFLDEVAELPPALQVSLLRALQEGEIVPVGADRPTHVDTRIISATHRDLRALVRQGRFREDLYFRLVVISVHLPPLRQRPGDIPLLVAHLLELTCDRLGKNTPRLTASVLDHFARYSWPGNVRELENELERLVILGNDGQEISEDLLSRHIIEPESAHTQTPNASPPSALSATNIAQQILATQRPVNEVLQQIERVTLEETLRRHDNNQRSAAKALGIPRQTLQSRLKKYGLGKG